MSQNQSLSIKLANMVSSAGNTPVIAENEFRSVESMIAELQSRKWDFDVAVIATSNPIKAAIAANRIDGVSAVACSSNSEIGTAINEGANVIIIGDGSFNPKAAYAGTAAGRQPEAVRDRLQRTKQERQQPKGAMFALPWKNVRRQAQKVQDFPESGERMWDKKKGLKKNIKDIFGVE